MTKDELQEYITENYAELSISEVNSKILNVDCPRDKVHIVSEKLKHDEKLQFDFLFCQTAIDWPEFLEVIYHLRSSDMHHELVMRVKTENREIAEVPTVCDIWRTADFHEREIYDLFGVVFINHPDLRRILLEDDRIGHPLRKDYVDEVNIIDL